MKNAIILYQALPQLPSWTLPTRKVSLVGLYFKACVFILC